VIVVILLNFLVVQTIRFDSQSSGNFGKICWIIHTLSTISSFYVTKQNNSGLGHLTVEVSTSNTHTHSLGRTPLNEWSARHKTASSIAHNKETKVHALRRILTRNSSHQMAADLCLRTHGYQDRQHEYCI